MDEILSKLGDIDSLPEEIEDMHPETIQSLMQLWMKKIHLKSAEFSACSEVVLAKMQMLMALKELKLSVYKNSVRKARSSSEACRHVWCCHRRSSRPYKSRSEGNSPSCSPLRSSHSLERSCNKVGKRRSRARDQVRPGSHQEPCISSTEPPLRFNFSADLPSLTPLHNLQSGIADARVKLRKINETILNLKDDAIEEDPDTSISSTISMDGPEVSMDGPDVHMRTLSDIAETDAETFPIPHQNFHTFPVQVVHSSQTVNTFTNVLTETVDNHINFLPTDFNSTVNGQINLNVTADFSGTVNSHTNLIETTVNFNNTVNNDLIRAPSVIPPSNSENTFLEINNNLTQIQQANHYTVDNINFGLNSNNTNTNALVENSNSDHIRAESVIPPSNSDNAFLEISTNPIQIQQISDGTAGNVTFGLTSNDTTSAPVENSNSDHIREQNVIPPSNSDAFIEINNNLVQTQQTDNPFLEVIHNASQTQQANYGTDVNVTVVLNSTPNNAVTENDNLNDIQLPKPQIDSVVTKNHNSNVFQALMPIKKRRVANQETFSDAKRKIPLALLVTIPGCGIPFFEPNGDEISSKDNNSFNLTISEPEIANEQNNAASNIPELQITKSNENSDGNVSNRDTVIKLDLSNMSPRLLSKIRASNKIPSAQDTDSKNMNTLSIKLASKHRRRNNSYREALDRITSSIQQHESQAMGNGNPTKETTSGVATNEESDLVHETVPSINGGVEKPVEVKPSANAEKISDNISTVNGDSNSVEQTNQSGLSVVPIITEKLAYNPNLPIITENLSDIWNEISPSSQAEVLHTVMNRPQNSIAVKRNSDVENRPQNSILAKKNSVNDNGSTAKSFTAINVQTTNAPTGAEVTNINKPIADVTDTKKPTDNKASESTKNKKEDTKSIHKHSSSKRRHSRSKHRSSDEKIKSDQKKLLDAIKTAENSVGGSKFSDGGSKISDDGSKTLDGGSKCSDSGSKSSHGESKTSDGESKTSEKDHASSSKRRRRNKHRRQKEKDCKVSADEAGKSDSSSKDLKGNTKDSKDTKSSKQDSKINDRTLRSDLNGIKLRVYTDSTKNNKQSVADSSNNNKQTIADSSKNNKQSDAKDKTQNRRLTSQICDTLSEMVKSANHRKSSCGYDWPYDVESRPLPYELALKKQSRASLNVPKNHTGVPDWPYDSTNYVMPGHRTIEKTQSSHAKHVRDSKDKTKQLKPGLNDKPKTSDKSSKVKSLVTMPNPQSSKQAQKKQQNPRTAERQTKTTEKQISDTPRTMPRAVSSVSRIVFNTDSPASPDKEPVPPKNVILGLRPEILEKKKSASPEPLVHVRLSNKFDLEQFAKNLHKLVSPEESTRVNSVQKKMANQTTSSNNLDARSEVKSANKDHETQNKGKMLPPVKKINEIGQQTSRGEDRISSAAKSKQNGQHAKQRDGKLLPPTKTVKEIGNHATQHKGAKKVTEIGNHATQLEITSLPFTQAIRKMLTPTKNFNVSKQKDRKTFAKSKSQINSSSSDEMRTSKRPHEEVTPQDGITNELYQEILNNKRVKLEEDQVSLSSRKTAKICFKCNFLGYDHMCPFKTPKKEIIYP